MGFGFPVSVPHIAASGHVLAVRMARHGRNVHNGYTALHCCLQLDELALCRIASALKVATAACAVLQPSGHRWSAGTGPLALANR
jgi:hypothetical protein